MENLLYFQTEIKLKGVILMKTRNEKIVEEFLGGMNLSKEDDRKKFYNLYKSAIESITLGRDQQVKNEDIVLKKGDGSAYAVIDFYNNKFKDKCGPILMDIGIEKTRQGKNMEYCQSSKPITFPGLAGCLGVKVGNKGGVHLLSIYENKVAKVYLERIEWIYKIGGENVNLKIATGQGGKTLDVNGHIKSLEDLLKDKNERENKEITIELNNKKKEKVEWFIKRLKDARDSNRVDDTNANNIATI